MMLRSTQATMIVAIALSSLWIASAAAQTPVPPTRVMTLKQGDPCTRKTDSNPGVVKRDACGRWYCGRRDIRDITEIAPNLANDIDCTWRLEGSRCLCRRAPAVRKEAQAPEPAKPEPAAQQPTPKPAAQQKKSAPQKPAPQRQRQQQ